MDNDVIFGNKFNTILYTVLGTLINQHWSLLGLHISLSASSDYNTADYTIQQFSAFN